MKNELTNSLTSKNKNYLTQIYNEGKDAKLVVGNRIYVFRGQWINGDAWERFGNYNSYVVIRNDGKVKIIPAQAGELAPGSTEDIIKYLKQNSSNLVRPQAPITIELDPTYNCCSHDCGRRCFSAIYRKKTPNATIPTPILKDIIYNYADAGGQIVRIDGGGDPLCHPAVRSGELVDLANDLFLKSTILTSGDLLSKANLERIGRANCYLRISLNAATNKTRRIFHGNSVSINEIYRTIKKYANWRDRENPQLPIGATFLVDLLNYRELFFCAMIAKDIGINHFSVRRILGPPYLRPNFSETQLSEINDLFLKTIELGSEHFKVFIPWRELNELDINPSIQDFSASRCWQSTCKVVIEPNSNSKGFNVQLCGRYRGGGVGQLLQLPELFTSEKSDNWVTNWRQSFETYIHSREALPRICNSCIDRGFILMMDKLTNFLENSLSSFSIYHLNLDETLTKQNGITKKCSRPVMRNLQQNLVIT